MPFFWISTVRGGEMNGSSLDDQIRGNIGPDKINGQGGDDVLRDHMGDDIVFGGDGDDTFFNGGGARDFWDGGDGIDTLVDDLRGLDDNTLIVNFKTGTHKAATASSGDTVKNMENLVVTGAWDVEFTGTKGANVVQTAKGDDTVRGRGGADTLITGDGDDRLIGNKGRDRLEGEKGDDVLKGGAGRDTFVFKSGDGSDLILDFEKKDRIELDAEFYTFGQTKAEFVESVAKIKKGNTVLEFSEGETLTLQGVTDLSMLAASLELG